jgi:Conjugal transfer protein TraD
MRTWQVERRKRTRHLIELGGLVVKAGVVDLTGDDRAIILGALLWMADKLESDQGERARALWAERASKRSRRTRRHTRRQIKLIWRFVVERCLTYLTKPGYELELFESDHPGRVQHCLSLPTPTPMVDAERASLEAARSSQRTPHRTVGCARVTRSRN